MKTHDPGDQATQHRRLRLLLLTSTLPAHPGDGTPEFVLTLGRALVGRYDITILTPRVPGAARHEDIGGVEIKRFPYFFSALEGLAHGAIMPNLRSHPWRVLEVPGLLLGFMLAALREVRSTRPDAVSAHWIIPAGLVALALARFKKIPYVLTIHGADAYSLRGNISRRLKRVVINHAAVVSPVSKDISRTLQLPPDDELVVPMGVDTTELTRSVGTRRPEAGRLLFVGRLAEKKGVDVLLRALETLEDVHAVVVGDGPDRESLEKMAARLRLSHRVVFRGQLPREQVMTELKRAHLIVIPSKVAADGDQDGTPVVMVEAMAAGVPIVASALGGLAEHITDGETGWLVTPDVPGSLAVALKDALSTEEAERRASAAREHFARYLAMDRVAARYSSFIERAVVGSR